MESVQSPTTTEAPSASPSKSPRKKRGKFPNASATVRELRKWHFYQNATELCNGIRERSGMIRSLTDKAGEVSTDVCQKVMETDIGKSIDNTLAVGVRKVKVATIGITSPVPKIKASLKRTQRRIVTSAIRYFPPLLLARWGIDFALFMSCITLAIARDIFRLTNANVDALEEKKDDNESTPLADRSGNPTDVEENLEGADGSPDRPIDTHVTGDPSPGPENVVALESQVESTQKVTEDGNISKTVDNRSLAECVEDILKDYPTIVEVARNILTIIKCLVHFVALVMMPMMMLMTLGFYRLSKFAHKISFEFDPETPEELKERQDMFDRLLASGPRFQDLEQLGPNEWLLDIVIDRYVAWLMKWIIIGRIIGFFFTRPVRIFGNILVFIKDVIYQRNEMVEYLKEDPNYDEGKDPDYQPNEAEVIDDSLEYKNDDELESDETDIKIARSTLQPNMNSSSTKMTSPGKETPPSNKSPSRRNRHSESSKGGDNSLLNDQVRRKNGFQACSTPKDTRSKVNRGTTTEEWTNETKNGLEIDGERAVILGPCLSPEKLKQIKTRGPIQAAVIRMKGDKIIEFRRRMRQKKLECKRKTKKKIIQKGSNGCEVIHETQENGTEAKPNDSTETEQEEDSSLQKSDAYENESTGHDNQEINLVDHDNQANEDEENGCKLAEENVSESSNATVPEFVASSSSNKIEFSDNTDINGSSTNQDNAKNSLSPTENDGKDNSNSLKDFPTTAISAKSATIDTFNNDTDTGSQKEFDSESFLKSSNNTDVKDIHRDSGDIDQRTISDSAEDTKMKITILNSPKGKDRKDTSSNNNDLKTSFNEEKDAFLLPVKIIDATSPQNPPGELDMHRNPGVECPEVLASKDEAHSSSVDTGQSTRGW